MKRYLKLSLFLLGFIVSFHLEAQQTFTHQTLIQKERRAALRRILQQPMANTGNYNVIYNRILLQPDLTSRNLTGKVTTYFTANENMSQIEFDFNSQMNVNTITYHGNTLNFNHTNNRLIINLPQNISTGTLDSIQVNYNGFVPDTGLGSYTVTTHNGKPVVWTLSEPYGARDWWPCKQDLTDKIDSIDIVLQYPETYNNAEMTGVSNGILTSENISQINGTNFKTSTWKHRYPIAAYLVAFAITDYTKFSQTAGIYQNFPLDNYVYPENLGIVQAQSAQFLPVMDYFEQSFGHYPFYTEKYGQIQFGWGGGMDIKPPHF